MPLIKKDTDQAICTFAYFAASLFQIVMRTFERMEGADIFRLHLRIHKRMRSDFLRMRNIKKEEKEKSPLKYEKVADALYIRKDIDLYITGSNAYFLSGDIATMLTGRSIELQVYPFSFKEYQTALHEVRQSQSGLDFPFDYPHDFSVAPLPREEAFNRYLTYGGLPYATRLTSEQEIAEYLGGVFSSILVKDIAQRRPRMDMRAFESTASFLADNVGNISSIKRIADGLGSSGRKVSPGAVSEYIDAMIETYLLYKVERYDLKGREYLQSLEKYYVGDLGFRFWLLGKSAGDVGRRIENVVYLELRRRFNRVSVGKRGTKEVDFVARSEAGVHYFQVAQTVADGSTLERELKPLQEIQDNYQKTLLTLDTIGTGDLDGIAHVNLLDWLLE